MDDFSEEALRRLDRHMGPALVAPAPHHPADRGELPVPEGVRGPAPGEGTPPPREGPMATSRPGPQPPQGPAGSPGLVAPQQTLVIAPRNTRRGLHNPSYAQPNPVLHDGGAPGVWQISDFSYEALVELGSMAVSTGLKKKQLDRHGPRPYQGPAESPCAICLEELRVGDPTLTVVCGHCFHHTCIVQWLLRCNRCPTCRFEIPRME